MTDIIKDLEARARRVLSRDNGRSARMQVHPSVILSLLDRPAGPTVTREVLTNFIYGLDVEWRDPLDKFEAVDTLASVLSRSPDEFQSPDPTEET